MQGVICGFRINVFQYVPVIWIRWDFKERSQDAGWNWKEERLMLKQNNNY
jgi:hypothetical protein